MFEQSPFPLSPYDRSKPEPRRATVWIIIALFVTGSVGVLVAANYIASMEGLTADTVDQSDGISGN